MHELKNNEEELSLLNLLILFVFLLSIVFYILYLTKLHEKTYMASKQITKQLNLEIKTKGVSNIYYCFTHSDNSLDNNMECSEKDALNENPFDYYNTLIMYLSKNGNFDNNKILSVYNYSESYIIFLDSDNNNFNNALSRNNKIFIIPSAIYTNSNKYQIQIINNKVDYEKIDSN